MMTTETVMMLVMIKELNVESIAAQPTTNRIITTTTRMMMDKNLQQSEDKMKIYWITVVYTKKMIFFFNLSALLKYLTLVLLYDEMN